MNKTIYLAAALMLGSAATSAVAGPADWVAPQEPFALYGNT